MPLSIVDENAKKIKELLGQMEYQDRSRPEGPSPVASPVARGGRGRLTDRGYADAPENMRPGYNVDGHIGFARPTDVDMSYSIITDEKTGVRHMPVKQEALFGIISGSEQSWQHPSGLRYRDPMAAAFGGPDYIKEAKRGQVAAPGANLDLLRGELSKMTAQGKMKRADYKFLLDYMDKMQPKTTTTGTETDAIAEPSLKDLREKEMFETAEAERYKEGLPPYVGLPFGELWKAIRRDDDDEPGI